MDPDKIAIIKNNVLLDCYQCPGQQQLRKTLCYYIDQSAKESAREVAQQKREWLLQREERKVTWKKEKEKENKGRRNKEEKAYNDASSWWILWQWTIFQMHLDHFITPPLSKKDGQYPMTKVLENLGGKCILKNEKNEKSLRSR